MVPAADLRLGRNHPSRFLTFQRDILDWGGHLSNYVPQNASPVLWHERLRQTASAWYTACTQEVRGVMVTTSIRLTSRLPVVVAGILLVLQIFSPAPPVMFGLTVLVVTLIVAYLWARQLAQGVAMNRERRYGWAQVGDVLEERFTLHNDAWVPILWAEVRDFSDLPGYSASRAAGLGTRSTSRWRVTGTCQQRGLYRLGPTQILMGDPFGLFEVTLTHDYSEAFVVYPPIAALPSLIEPRGMSRGSTRTNIRSLDFTTNASSVRQYAPGDALKRIHWRSTARRSTPEKEEIYVKEFDLEPAGDLWIVLDMDKSVHVGEGAESTEEYGVILAASLAYQMLRSGHAVGLITHGDEPSLVPARRGHHQLWEILRVLAGAHAVSRTPFHELLMLFEPVMGRGMTAALITPSTDPAWLRGVSALLRHGIHSAGLLLDAHSFGGDGNIQGIMGALADLGIGSHVIARGFDFQYIGQRRHQRPQYRALGTGRVIVTDAGDETQRQWVPVGRTKGDVS